MANFKCKMCGGTLNVSEDMIVCECEYCGHKQNVPKSCRIPVSIDDDDEYYEEDENDEEDEDDEKEIARKLKRGYTCLKIEDWKKARDYFRGVLRYNNDECAEAYLGIFLADYKLKSVNELENTGLGNLLKWDNYKEAYLFGNKALKKKLKHYAEINDARAKEKQKQELEKLRLFDLEKKLEEKYNKAIDLMITDSSHYTGYRLRNHISSESIEEIIRNNYMRAKEFFDSNPDYKDSSAKSKECDIVILF